MAVATKFSATLSVVLLSTLILAVLGSDPQSEPYFTCIDETLPSDWIQTDILKYCADVSCLPSPYNSSNVNATGFWYVHNNRNISDETIFLAPRHELPDRNEYLFIRYLLIRDEWQEPNYETSVYPILNNDKRLLHSSRGSWREDCYELNHAVLTKRGLRVDGFIYDDILIVDKMIYLTLPADQKIACSHTEDEEIRQYCSFSSSSPPTTTTEEMTTSTGPTTEPPPPTECPLNQNWVDVESDLLDNGWSYPASLKYAADTSELPYAFLQNLTSATGLLYFQGPAGGAISRPKTTSSTSGEAHLYIRYYIHHTSPADPQQYFVLPVADKVMGVQYLDATSDLRWKEAFLHLENDDDSNVSFRIGTTGNIESGDVFIIDKIIYIQRE